LSNRPATTVSFSTWAWLLTKEAWNIDVVAFLTTYLTIDSDLLSCQFSLLISIELPNIPSPTTASPFRSPQFLTSPSSFTVRAVPPTDRNKAA